MRFLRSAVSAVFSYYESLEVSRLKKKLLKTESQLKMAVSDFENSQADLESALSTIEVLRRQFEDQIAVVNSEASTLKDSNTYLRQENKRLEESIAEAKSQLALNALEKELMSDLFEKLRQKVRADIASAHDAYANERSEQSVDAIPRARRSAG